MAVVKIKCTNCKSENVVKNGRRPNGIQCLKCNNCSKCFQEHYTNNAAKPETKQLIIKMSVNGSGIRDISRVLDISTNTVMSVLKKLKTFLYT